MKCLKSSQGPPIIPQNSKDISCVQLFTVVLPSNTTFTALFKILKVRAIKSNSKSAKPRSSKPESYKKISKWLHPSYENNQERSIVPFTSNLGDPFLGYEVHTAYIPVANPKGEVFYSYWDSTSGVKNPPVIICNAGGPGVTTQMMALISGGPFDWNYISNTYTRRDTNNLLELGDLLMPDLPTGVGYSLTDTYDLSIEQWLDTSVQFFVNLANDKTAKGKKIDLKNRDIIMYGISYGAALFSSLSVRLLKLGFRIKGIFYDSPFFSATASVQQFPYLMKKYHIMAAPKLKKFARITSHCLDLMKKPVANFTTKDGLYCGKLYSSYSPYISPSTHTVTATGYNLSKSPKAILRAFIFTSRVAAIFLSPTTAKTFNAKSPITPAGVK
jgi:carboxypeptidase C (cathepsin A)